MGAHKQGPQFEYRENVARGLGYLDWEQLIECTRDLTLAQVSALTGRSIKTIWQWRNRPSPSISDLRHEVDAGSVRELAQSAVMVTDIAKALGKRRQNVYDLMQRMPDGAELRAQVRKNRERASAARKELRAKQKPARYTPSAEEVAVFKDVCDLARRFKAHTRMGSPVWRAREMRDDRLIDWRRKGLTGPEIAQYSGYSIHAVRLWYSQLVRSERIPRSTERTSNEKG